VGTGRCCASTFCRIDGYAHEPSYDSLNAAASDDCESGSDPSFV
jgi:hypothetical protein